MATLPAVLSLFIGVALVVNPQAYEQNLITALLLGCAWVLQELQSVAVLKSLVLALLQGEACHRTLVSYGVTSVNVFWVTVFALLQDEPLAVARLVSALAVVSIAFGRLWNTTLMEAIRQRSQSEYWSLGNSEGGATSSRDAEGRERELDQEDDMMAPVRRAMTLRRTEVGTLLQLLITRRAYEMLSRRSRSSSQLQDALQQFLASGGSERSARDRFTMAVFSAISRQGTATVIRTAESSHVGRFASRAAAFVERRFTASALNRVEQFFKPLPFGLDPSEQNGWQTFALLLAVLTVHKRMFQELKAQVWFKGKTEKMALFLTKQTTRISLVTYIMVRYLLGLVRRADPIAPDIVTPHLLGEVRRQGNDSILASPTPQRNPRIRQLQHPQQYPSPDVDDPTTLPLVNSVLRLDTLSSHLMTSSRPSHSRRGEETSGQPS